MSRDARIALEIASSASPPDDPAIALIQVATIGTEGALARLFVEAHGATARFVREDAAWAVWSGDRWRRDASLEARNLLAERAREFYAAAAGAPGDDARKALAKFATKADCKRFQTGALALAEPPLAASATQFDADPGLLNVRNGTLDLRARAVRPHDPAAFCSRIAGARFDPRARCPVWLAALDRWLGGDAEAVAFAQRLAGYLLLGAMPEKRIVILAGPRDSGKTTFIETLKMLLGDYSATIALDTLLEPPRGRDGSHHSDDVAALAGRRAAFGAESMKGRRLDGSRVKLLTGRDTISARRVFGRTFEFANTAKLVLATNHLPRLDGGDAALAGRLAVLPFPHSIPPGDQDCGLPEKLRAEVESGGILSWALTGLAAWREAGLGAATAVREATANYVAAEDVVGRFLDERCELGAGRTELRSRLAHAWSLFLDEEAEPKVSETRRPQTLYDELKARGCKARTVRQSPGAATKVRAFGGVSLRPLGDPAEPEI